MWVNILWERPDPTHEFCYFCPNFVEICFKGVGGDISVLVIRHIRLEHFLGKRSSLNGPFWNCLGYADQGIDITQA